jgi:hypothetical protein
LGEARVGKTPPPSQKPSLSPFPHVRMNLLAVSLFVLLYATDREKIIKRIRIVVSYMNIEIEIRDIKQHLIEISKKIDEPMYEREITGMMKLPVK